MKNLQDILDDYLAAIEASGSLLPKALGPAPEEGWVERFETLELVKVPDALKTYFSRINGWDIHACSELDLFEPELAWGMFPLSAERSFEDHDDIADSLDDGEDEDEDGDYWPHGFLPILADGAGSWVVVNCRAASPTFGAVYEMTHCVGVNRIAGSLADFFAASTRVVTEGWKQFDRDTSRVTVGDDEYADLVHGAFGDAPYFTTRGSEQVIDWK